MSRAKNCVGPITQGSIWSNRRLSQVFSPGLIQSFPSSDRDQSNRTPEMPSIRSPRNNLEDHCKPFWALSSCEVQLLFDSILYFFGIGMRPDTLRHLCRGLTRRKDDSRGANGGTGGLFYMRLDRQRETLIRSMAGQDPHPMDVGERGNRRIRPPTR
jgi:hypothetical protein